MVSLKSSFNVLLLLGECYSLKGGSSLVKNCLLMLDMQVRSMGQEDPLEKEMETHSSIFV